VPERIEAWAGARLVRWVEGVTRHPRATVTLVLIATACLGLYAAMRLGVNTDHKRLISDRLEFQRFWHEYAEHFPTLDDAILVVLEADSAAQTREATAALAERLERQPELFTSVFVPGGDPFFERHGLLYHTVDELDRLVGELAGIQPLLAELARDSSIANLARLMRRGLEQELPPGTSEVTWQNLLEGIQGATLSVYQEPPVSVPWERLLFEGSSFDPDPLRVLIVDPVLDFDRLLPAARAIAAIRASAHELDVGGPGLRVRLTGNPVLNHEEMIGLAWDLGAASVLSMLLVSAVLQLAFRSWRIVRAAAVTLVVGLIWTAAFATAAIGELNVVSVAFAVLFVGLGVDFSIHLGAHYTALRRDGSEHDGALRGAVGRVGGALALCTLTTAIGFYSFLPTDFRGVAELGLVAGTGMFVILFLTLTLFPVLLGRDPALGSAQGWDPVRSLLAPLLGLSRRHPARVVAAAGIVAVAAGLLAPRARFDANVVGMRDPDSESVQAFETLLSRPNATPWSLDVLAPDATTARELAEEIAAVPGVLRAASLADYVPSDQPDKLALLEEASLMLYFPEPSTTRSEPLPVEEQIEAVRELHAVFDFTELDAPPALTRSARGVRAALEHFLERASSEPDPTEALAELETRLLGELPLQLSRLKTALGAGPVTLEDLPPDLVLRMLAPDGTSRVQVLAEADLSEADALHAFVDQVRVITSSVTGIPVHLVEFGRATARSLREALLVAGSAITLLLVALWWRVRDPLRVLAVLTLGAAATAAGMVLLGEPFNFANVIVIPLLLGVGVDSSIHIVERWRSGASESVEATTARAILYSALTTLASFGTLTLSSHRGIASLGAVLVLGMILMTLSSLVVLPALLRLRSG
jgi:hopanoid biosynthesis associated RND transporter like protein HpnN